MYRTAVFVVFSLVKVQRKMQKDVTSLSRWSLITSPSRRTCVPGAVHCCTWSYYLSSSQRMLNDGCLSPSIPVCVPASCPLPVPRQPQGPPPGEMMGRNWGLIWQEPDRIKLEPGGTTLGSSHPFRASFHSPRGFQHLFDAEIHREPAEGEGVAFSDPVL